MSTVPNDPARTPGSVSQPTCPLWCTVDHAIDVDLDDLRDHRAPVMEWSSYGELYAEVSVAAVDNLTEGTRTPASVCVTVKDALAPAEARHLILGILDALDVLEDAS